MRVRSRISRAKRQGKVVEAGPCGGYSSDRVSPRFTKTAPKGGRRPVKRAASKSRRSVISTDLLLHRVATGDQEAVRACISRYGGLVWSLARRIGLSDSEAEDAVQEVFTAIWQNAYRYDATIASETAFIATIARRRLIDRRRKVGRRPVASAITEEITASAAEPVSSDVSEDAARAASALTRLSDEQQRVLRLSVYEGLSHELIARATGLPLGTVKTHARRGLMRLRALLSDSTEEAAETVAGKGDSPEGTR